MDFAVAVVGDGVVERRRRLLKVADLLYDRLSTREWTIGDAGGKLSRTSNSGPNKKRFQALSTPSNERTKR